MFYNVLDAPRLNFTSSKEAITPNRGGSRTGGEGGKHGLEDLSPYWDFPLGDERLQALVLVKR
jgi:hypothetical protein